MDCKKLILRDANILDEKLIFNWSNESEARQSSINNQKIDIKNHKIWFKNEINNNDSLIWILEYIKEPCGLVRFNKYKKNFDKLSYLIDKKFRGKKLGTKLLKMAIKKKKNIRKMNIHAFTLKHNESSKRTIELAGFKFKKETNDKLLYVYEYGN